jgi:hypothetical protein
MCDVKTDALTTMLADTSNEDSNQYGCSWCRGEWDCTDQPPVIRHEDTCTVVKARAQLAAILADNERGQTITSDVCDKCWGSGDESRPWANLKKVASMQRELDRFRQEQCS